MAPCVTYATDSGNALSGVDERSAAACGWNPGRSPHRQRADPYDTVAESAERFRGAAVDAGGAQ
jgi:hypothetical protein